MSQKSNNEYDEMSIESENESEDNESKEMSNQGTLVLY